MTRTERVLALLQTGSGITLAAVVVLNWFWPQYVTEDYVARIGFPALAAIIVLEIALSRIKRKREGRTAPQVFDRIMDEEAPRPPKSA